MPSIIAQSKVITTCLLLFSCSVLLCLLTAAFSEWSKCGNALLVAEESYPSVPARDTKAKTDKIEDADTRRQRLSWLLDRAGAYYDRENYNLAQPLYEQALQIEESLGPADHHDVALALNCLASNEQEAGHYDSCERNYNRAIRIIEKSSGTNSPELVVPLLNLGNLYETVGEYEQAKDAYRRALPIAEKASEPHKTMKDIDDDSTIQEYREYLADLNDGLGVVYNDLRQCKLAEPFLQKALKERLSSHPVDRWRIAESYNSLASLRFNEGRFRSAKTLYEKALAVHGQSGRHNIDETDDLNGVGLCCSALKDYHRAACFFRRALDIKQDLLGPDHFHVALAKANLAGSYADEGQTREAEKLFKESIATIEKSFGARPKNLNIVWVFNNYADLLHRLKKPSEAEQFRARAREIEG